MNKALDVINPGRESHQWACDTRKQVICSQHATVVEDKIAVISIYFLLKCEKMKGKQVFNSPKF